MCAAIVTEPLDVVRTRLMTQGKNPHFQYEGLLHGLQTAARREGLYSLWKGLLPVYCRQAPFNLLNYLIMESLTQRVLGRSGY